MSTGTRHIRHMRNNAGKLGALFGQASSNWVSMAVHKNGANHALQTLSNGVLRCCRTGPPSFTAVGARQQSCKDAAVEHARNVLIAQCRESSWAVLCLRPITHPRGMSTLRRRQAADWRKFDFLPSWHTLDAAQKLAKLQEHACHELHFFVQQRDPRLFASAVLPMLRVRRLSAARMSSTAAPPATAQQAEQQMLLWPLKQPVNTSVNHP